MSTPRWLVELRADVERFEGGDDLALIPASRVLWVLDMMERAASPHHDYPGDPGSQWTREFNAGPPTEHT